jgi:hypothetical protein
MRRRARAVAAFYLLVLMLTPRRLGEADRFGVKVALGNCGFVRAGITDEGFSLQSL